MTMGRSFVHRRKSTRINLTIIVGFFIFGYISLYVYVFYYLYFYVNSFEIAYKYTDYFTPLVEEIWRISPFIREEVSVMWREPTPPHYFPINYYKDEFFRHIFVFALLASLFFGFVASLLYANNRIHLLKKINNNLQPYPSFYSAIRSFFSKGITRCTYLLHYILITVFFYLLLFWSNNRLAQYFFGFGSEDLIGRLFTKTLIIFAFGFAFSFLLFYVISFVFIAFRYPSINPFRIHEEKVTESTT